MHIYDDPNPDENYFHSKHLYYPDRVSYPEEDCIFCDLKIDGYKYKTCLAFVESMRKVVKENIPYTPGMRFKDTFRWLDIPLAKRRRKQIRLSKLNEEEKYDLLFLYKEGFVRARVTGQSITRIYGEIENLINKTLRVRIKPGTYFVAKGNYQNMVTREEYTVTIDPISTRNVSINAACINANLPIAGEQDRFYGVRRVSDDLTRFLEASKNADSMTIQAGVWALTDNYSGYDVKNHLVLTDQYGNRRQAVSDHNIEEAKRILKEIGIRSRL